MRDRPKPAARMCTAIPVLVPSAETIPALRPPAILRDMTNSIPGPGAMTTNRVAKKKQVKVSHIHIEIIQIQR
jgi:hypothetical protein